jgi:hypothetical protein
MNSYPVFIATGLTLGCSPLLAGCSTLGWFSEEPQPVTVAQVLQMTKEKVRQRTSYRRCSTRERCTVFRQERWRA